MTEPREAREANPTLKIGTWNCGTLRNKFEEACGYLESLDILCMQEVRVSDMALPSVQGAARMRGLRYIGCLSSLDAEGNVTRGVGILSKWPVSRTVIPGCDQRTTAIVVHRPGERELLVVNVYGHADRRYIEKKRQLYEDIAEFVAKFGLDAILLGDHNCLVEEQPIAELYGTGQWQNWDAHFEDTRPTHQQRVIDFAMGRGPTVVSRRQQATGSDHHLVQYDIALKGKLQPRLTWRKQIPLKTALQGSTKEERREEREEIEAAFQRGWASEAPRFQGALRGGDVDEAWTLLSKVAEEVLRDPDAKGAAAPTRHKVAEPTQRHEVASQAKRGQGLAERRLRRLLRRLEEAARGKRTPQLRGAIERSLAQLGKKRPSLQQYQWDSPLLVNSVRAAAEEEAESTKTKRINEWKQSMATDMTARIRWVMKEPDLRGGGTAQDPHPSARARRMYEELKPRWCKPLGERPPWPAEVEEWIEANRKEADPIEWDGDELYQYARKTVGTGGGPDSWRAASLCLLGKTFWKHLAALWQKCVEMGKLPAAWVQARVCGIPKPGSEDLRPISVATIAWRLGCGYMVRQLRKWVDGWAPPEIVGGLAGRDPSDFYDSFGQHIAQMAEAGIPLVGAKLDLEKCFDLICHGDANDMLRRLGAPEGFIRILEKFDSDQSRYCEADGHVHGSPIAPTRSLMQGCPASPLRLTVVMAAWVYFVGKREPEMKSSLHMDDRVIWLDARAVSRIDLIPRLRTFMQQNEEFEKAFDMKDNAKKRCFFASTSKLREKLKVAYPGTEVAPDIEILGIKFGVTGKRRRIDAKKQMVKARRRMYRIQAAGRTIKDRRTLARACITSLISWTFRWAQLRGETLKSLSSIVERATVGRGNLGRIKALAEALQGQKGSVEFQQTFSRLMLPKHRIKRRAPRNRWFAGTLLAQAVESLGWTMEADRGKIITKEGPYDPEIDGDTAFRNVAWRAHLDKVRKGGVLAAAAADDEYLHLEEHRKFAEKALHHSQAKTAVATGKGTDAKLWAKMQKKEPRDFPCSCGELGPTRRHLTYLCEDRGKKDLEEPANTCQATYLVRAMPWPRTVAGHDLQEEEMIARAVSELLRRQPKPYKGFQCIVGTDGGADNDGRRTEAAWGASFWVQGGDNMMRIGGAVKGLDRTPGMAELIALLMVVRVLKKAGEQRGAPIKTLIITDHLRAVRGLKTAGPVANPGALGGIGKKIREERRGAALSIKWVPSHGKQEEWQPEAPYHEDASLWRRLNEEADKQCTELLVVAREREATEIKQFNDRREWTISALAQQSEGCCRFMSTARGHL